MDENPRYLVSRSSFSALDGSVRSELRHSARPCAQFDFGIVEVADLAIEESRLDYRFTGEFESFKTAEGLLEVFACRYYTVIFQDHAVVAFGKRSSDARRPEPRCRSSGGAKPAFTAYVPGLMEQPGVGNLMHQTERHQCDRMCVNYALHFGARLINRPMQRQLRR